ncbi:MAG: hypothetical protein K0Q90_1641 [Paenibacillaceae bacterium]|nr:hypothetical protein [Paenibacillaceae bacterium]
MRSFPHRSRAGNLLVLGAAVIGTLVYVSPLNSFTGGTVAVTPDSGAGGGNIEVLKLAQAVEMEFVKLQPGSFTMGAPQELGDEDESPVHNVKVTNSFYLGKHEVTQEQWEAVMKHNPSTFKGAKLPVETVSWEDCQRFLAELRTLTGRRFALPTEAQWEYAARAGTTTPWSFGESGELAEDFGWFAANSGGMTHPAGEKKPNPWGLYDMYGNVQEWISDWYMNPYPKGEAVDPEGPPSGDARVLRGGAWGDYPAHIRSSSRNCMGPTDKHEGAGLRLVLLQDN